MIQMSGKIKFASAPSRFKDWIRTLIDVNLNKKLAELAFTGLDSNTVTLRTVVIPVFVKQMWRIEAIGTFIGPTATFKTIQGATGWKTHPSPHLQERKKKTKLCQLILTHHQLLAES